MRKLHEIIKDRWQAEKRHHNPFFNIVSADKLYSSARNDILDLLAAIANQEARLTALEQRIKGLHAALAECQAQAAALARADSLTAAEYDDLIYLCRQAEQINNTPSVRQRYHRLAEKMIERQRLTEAAGSAADE